MLEGTCLLTICFLVIETFFSRPKTLQSMALDLICFLVALVLIHLVRVAAKV
jgi:hypothetical protein